jgi:S1-C subfamily serine protease
MTDLAKSLVKVIVIWTITLTCVVIVSSVVSLNTNIGIITRITQAQIKDINAQIQNGKEVKPTYEELKSHSVFVIGCADQILDEEEDSKFFPIDKDNVCWSGSGEVIKITETETYILSNNHVFGKNTVNPIIYIEDGDQKYEAKIIKYHDDFDMAVARISVVLKNKTPLTKISSIEISEKAYVVGNPMGDKFTYSEGVLAGFVDKDYIFQIPLIFGSSGSGIFDKNGNLVALVYALEMYPGFFGIPEARITHTLAIKVNHIAKFLRELGLYNDD